ncbi:MAG: hypothetical protein ABII12_14665 [Planctomycetota bacterium]
MTDIKHRPNRLAAWYEWADRPGWLLVGLVFLLYLPFMFGDFALDDHRCVRVLRGYSAGERESLGIYRFVRGGPANAAAREAGWYPWWLADGLRYMHLRPVTEWVLYGEYRVFGEWPGGFRLVGIALYAVAVRLVLAIFRSVGGDERLARWSALIFALAAGHAIPVVFISAQCDLLALVFAAGAVLAGGRFIQCGGAGRLVLAAMLFVPALFSKEAALPAAVMPLCFWVSARRQPGVNRRAMVCTGMLVLCGLLWLAYYSRGGYGSNAALILDPLRAPLDYLATAPWRAVLLLSTWIIPASPFVFRLHPGWLSGLYVYGAIGGAILVLLARMYWRHHRHQRGVAGMALCVLPFLPLLVCTIPDDRVMALPSIGLAFLAGAWMTRQRADGSHRLRRVPLFLFVVLQTAAAVTASGLMWFMENEAQRHLRVMVDSFGREARQGDHIFFLNTTRNFEALFVQDRLNHVTNDEPVAASILTDIVEPTVRVVDGHTLRLESIGEPFLSSFVGQMGSTRSGVRRAGDVVVLEEFEASIVRVEDGRVRAIEFRFKQPLLSDSYRFYWSSPTAPPVLYQGLGMRVSLTSHQEKVNPACSYRACWNTSIARHSTSPN